jgi:hypothetical protein
MFAIGLAWVFGTTPGAAPALAFAQEISTPNDLVGKWHLLGSADDEVNIPMHRMDLVFKMEDRQLKGAILSRTTGEEIPLSFVKFEDSTFQLQMRPPAGKDQASMPILTMKPAERKLEGRWMTSATESVGPLLKLIRAPK